MNCRDVRAVADSLVTEEWLTETNHEVLRHLDSCVTCRTEIDGRRRLRIALRTAFNRATDLQPSVAFTDRLRDQLRDASVHRHRRSTFPRWFALAAGLVLATALAAVVLNRSMAPVDALARDAIEDHQNCALKYRLVRTPMPLEEAAQRFDRAYRLLLSAPPDDISTPGGLVRVVDRHSCAYGARRFGHVVMQYRDRVVSLLVTAKDATGAELGGAIPQVIGRPMDGLSVVSVNGTHHAILLVGDVGGPELTQLSRVVSLPLVERVGSLVPDRRTPTVLPIPQPVRELAMRRDATPVPELRLVD
jgi:hypothetical protein